MPHRRAAPSSEKLRPTNEIGSPEPVPGEDMPSSLERSGKTRTRERFKPEARGQRSRGRKLLARSIGRSAGRKLRHDTLRHAALLGSFERFYPVIEHAAHLLERHGAALVGKTAAGGLITRFGELLAAALTERQRELEAAKAYIAEVSAKMGSGFVTPALPQPVFDAKVRASTQLAERALEVFVLSEQPLTEFETLCWNQLRAMSTRKDELLRAKRVVRPIFAFAATTATNLARLREQAGAERVDRVS